MRTKRKEEGGVPKNDRFRDVRHRKEKTRMILSTRRGKGKKKKKSGAGEQDEKGLLTILQLSSPGRTRKRVYHNFSKGGKGEVRRSSE